MADAAAARREARRRKILENSHNRLQLISGKNVDEDCKEPSIKAPISAPIQVAPVILENSSFDKCTVNNGIINSGDSFDFNSTNYEDFAIRDGDVTDLSHDLAAFVAPSTSEPVQSQPIKDILVNIIYVGTKQLWFPKQQRSNFANVLMLLNGMSANRIQRIVSITQWVSAFSQDLCVFLFTTICLQSTLHFIRSSII